MLGIKAELNLKKLKFILEFIYLSFLKKKLTRKGPVLHPEFRTHIFPGGRAPSQSDEMDIHFSLMVIYRKKSTIEIHGRNDRRVIIELNHQPCVVSVV